MTFEQGAVFAIICCAMVLFVWGRIRYDLVAVLALLAGVFLGVVPADSAFAGFGHPAVVTVAAVLIISKAMEQSGVVNHLVRLLAPTRMSTSLQVAAGSTVGAALSCVMNNVGALALMLPVVMRNALKAGRSPGLVLMPLSFASLLGGLVTLIGTPPNIVISGYRQELSGVPFGMFDFAPVGLAIAAVGLAYLALFGWRLLPDRLSVGDPNDGFFHVESYSVETRVPEGSPVGGLRVRELEALCEGDVTVLALIRNGDRRLAPRATVRIREGDILILQGDPTIVQPLADGKRLGKLGRQTDEAGTEGAEGADSSDAQEHSLGVPTSEDILMVEAVVMPNSAIEGLSMRGVRMHDRFGVNLLALARQGKPTKARLKNVRFKTGDVLFLQGEGPAIDEALRQMRCLILADRGLEAYRPGGRALLAISIFAASIVAASLGLLSVPIAFTTAVVGLVMTRTISVGEIYQSIEWPVIFLLAALIPVGKALQQTGGTELISGALITAAADVPPWAMIALILVVSMWLSDVVHNTPTAVLMAPIAASIAAGLNLNPDSFLMAVAVGAASPYLTPIGHQSNTLVMGPGGYHFGDYARVGLPLEVLIVLVGVPMIIWVWPLT